MKTPTTFSLPVPNYKPSSFKFPQEILHFPQAFIIKAPNFQLPILNLAVKLLLRNPPSFLLGLGAEGSASQQINGKCQASDFQFILDHQAFHTT